MKRITREMIQAARARALATIAGTYEAPAPKKASRSTRFMPAVKPRQRELAVRSKTGTRIGPR